MHQKSARYIGFTLIELLIAIAILTSMAAITFVAFTGAQSTGRDTRRRNDLRQYQTSLETYANRNNGLYPIQTGGASAATMCTTLALTGTCIDDPRSPTTTYRYISNAGGTAYTFYASLEKPFNNQPQYFVVCSTGNVGRVPRTGTGAWTPSATCPNNLAQ